jgi:hypothetical protein
MFLFAIFLGGTQGLLHSSVRVIYLLGLSVYLLVVFLFSIQKDLRLIPLVFMGIITTHLAYGVYFLKGLISARLCEERK